MSTRDWLELSLAQRSIWLEAKLNPTSLYLLGGWSKVAAYLEESDVRQSISLMMARHEALRLRVDDEKPRQWLDASVQAPLTVAQLDPSKDEDIEFEAYVERAFRQRLPWGDHPLFHIDLIRANSGTCYLLWRFHHLIADSYSVPLAIDYWVHTYLALTSNSTAELPPGSSYVRIVESDQIYLKSRAYQEDISYWKSRFRALPPLLIEHPGLDLAPQGTAFSSEWIVDEEQYAKLIAIGQDAGMPLQRIIFGLFTMSLSVHYRQTDLVVGLALHRREHSNRFALGMFSGVIPVRYDFRNPVPVLKSLHQFSEQIDSDLRHQRLSADELARALGLFRAGRPRLFEVVMSYLPAVKDKDPMDADGITVGAGTPVTRESSPISLHVQELMDTAGLKIIVSVNDQVVNASEADAISDLLRRSLQLFFQDANVNTSEFFSRLVVPQDLEIRIEDGETSQSREEWVL